MIEVIGDIWKYKADVKCVTTNGYVRKDGKAVMGRGVALQAVGRWPILATVLGTLLTGGENVPYIIGGPPAIPFPVVSFPVKHHWKDKADLELIRRSAEKLVILASNHPEWKTYVIPRPGCGNGQLSWSEVEPVIEPILDDRFHIIELEARLD